MRSKPNSSVPMPGASGTVIAPGSTIGILGGGQLGRMMIQDGSRLGYRFATLDPTPDSPAAQLANHEIVAPYSDVAAARELAAASDVITYEFENVDAGVAKVLEEEGDVPQGSRLLFTTQHRLREKDAIVRAGAPVANHRGVTTREDLRRAIDDIGLPCVLKTTTGGYDGKGQWLIRTTEDAASAFDEWSAANRESAGGGRTVGLVESRNADDSGASSNSVTFPAASEGREASPRSQAALEAPLIVEQFVPFEKELSVLVARSRNGETSIFPVAENVHVNHILHLSIVPARIDSAIQERARDFAKRIAESLGAVGILAVEMFLTASGDLYVNELAPRPHNSGHYTLDGCVTSQFEQHVRSICGLPLGSPNLLIPVVMVNVLGQHVPGLMAKMGSLPGNIKVHLYGKAEAKADRKMGHLNVVADTCEEALAQIVDLGIW